ncbi:LLM class F420-dependent oxidoreductase [Actinobacteria bacterium YIM 96077]|uniref:LLM class F420-dependent oxidoreductase n=1 Tax=Phytoactinopolyspora halophila TaxID=1981511 RepID=A0A329QED3_9ACTN|nr:LLM class F420-dependent oxidoreductase [Phytoactinopolyspora halophila]AYY13421.1 LLM class F420-dependent oxidoreductase [Actinobacteria bacterium YIM 96077]RAW10815.1 LLM class F420-dependent oxidoreductase [Phytoactinopolyspora halophila]
MQLRIFTEPQQGATYEDQLRVAQATERLGFDAFFRSDHFLAMGDTRGLPGPTDAWLTLAALARETTRIRLGTLVTAATFRYPGMLAVQAAQVDHMSGGRLEVGLGAGWYAAEHAAYGVPFPPRRFELLEEQLKIITGMWETPVGGRFDFGGDYYTVANSPALPKPVQDPLPLIIGGHGPKRTPVLVARYATEYNAPFPPKDEIGDRFARVRKVCDDGGRDPGEMAYSVALVLACGQNEAEFERRAAAIGREPAELRQNGIAGTTQEVVDELGRLRDLGADRVYLQVLDLSDLEHLELVASEVAPHVT